MGSGILGVGQSGIAAAQAGLVTTGHNIANASTPGYTRQVVVQTSAGSQDTGFGFIGKGTQVSDVKRVFSEFLNTQVMTSQSSKYQLDTYYAQISRINNQFADSTSGLSPVLQDFFKGVQDMAANPSSTAARQTALSSAETLAARFQGLSNQLKEVEASVRGQIGNSVDTINVYTKQIAKLNDAIEKAQGQSDGRPSNDLLDQRDYAISELSKEIKTTVVKQGNTYNVFIGNGQPVVVGTKTYDLVSTTSAADPSRTAVGYVSNGEVIELADSHLNGGKLGGLLEFRSKALDLAQNSLGRIATGLAMTFNAQHALGQDQTGALGGSFFKVGAPDVRAGVGNTGNAVVGATVTDANALTTSDYRLQYTGGNYVVTRLSDNAVRYTNAAFPAGAVDGINFNIASGTIAAGDEYVIKPTANAAGGFGVTINDVSKIAAAAPIRTTAPLTNTGTGTISAGTVNGPPPTNANLQQPVTITFTSATTFNVTGTGTGNPVGVAYTPGGNITYNGWTVQLSGAPANGDTFTIGPNTNGTGDNRNALLLAAQQTANTLGNGTASYQGAYAQLVSQVGNKTREVEVTGKAESKFLAQAVAQQQAESGVNLDEEAANLMRYQQAYQAAAKVMQTAGELFDLLLTMGN
ncbi:MAG TPA: flagellar hook-associated protein FlgK [Noviherbaspirillum sp.]|uniref:flagellar hook-associated protein FlgK n=1 Tax=Noviherbaspirillum sp. TaxID=1926288 RepID=UPI002DDCB7B7|nr:flagellar hook-associated protein FlgK [Noviherbaspirillum sp.]HEV2609540.1 flagellar hook-associated protein FlgK [Noviherbaspirillum sp.]